MEADVDFTLKSANFKACNMVINEKLNLKNFLHDAMDFHAVRQLMVKSRHKILMPTLVLHLTKTKLNEDGEYRSSFARNLHERTDKPVFTVEDAVNQLKSEENRTEVEKAMDEFFITHLPQDILDEGTHSGGNELDEATIRKQKRAELAKDKKFQTSNQLPSLARNGGEFQAVRPVKQKSDLTLAFMDSGDQVQKLA